MLTHIGYTYRMPSGKLRKILILSVLILLAGIVIFWAAAPTAHIEGVLSSESDGCTDSISTEPCIRVEVSSMGRELRIKWSTDSAPKDSKAKILLYYYSDKHAHNGVAEVIAGEDDYLAPSGELAWSIPLTRIVCQGLDACARRYVMPFRSDKYMVRVSLYPSNFCSMTFPNPRLCPEGTTSRLIGSVMSSPFPIRRPLF